MPRKYIRTEDRNCPRTTAWRQFHWMILVPSTTVFCCSREHNDPSCAPHTAKSPAIILHIIFAFRSPRISAQTCQRKGRLRGTQPQCISIKGSAAPSPFFIASVAAVYQKVILASTNRLSLSSFIAHLHRSSKLNPQHANIR